MTDAELIALDATDAKLSSTLEERDALRVELDRNRSVTSELVKRLVESENRELACARELDEVRAELNVLREKENVQRLRADAVKEQSNTYRDMGDEAIRQRDALRERVMELRDEIEAALSWAHTYKTVHDFACEVQRILNADARATTAPDDSPNSRG